MPIRREAAGPQLSTLNSINFPGHFLLSLHYIDREAKRKPGARGQIGNFSPDSTVYKKGKNL
jgi:regulator of sirC expression with transglutaminase-like and TPR domain